LELNQTWPGDNEAGSPETIGTIKLALLAIAKLPLSIVAIFTDPLLIAS
jgi:hypothetical protein